MKQIVIVAGNSRSGTTQLGKAFRRVQNAIPLIEPRGHFKDVAHYARHMNEAPGNYHQILQDRYTEMWLNLSSGPDFFVVDKTHPIFFHWDHLNKIQIPVKVLWIYRNGLDVVSSMINHRGVSKNTSPVYWNKNDTVDEPIYWLGVKDTEEYRNWHKNLSHVQRCALRWASWILYWENNRPNFQFSTIDVSYENLTCNNLKYEDFILDFVESKRSNPLTPVFKTHADSVEVWRSRLTDKQVDEVLQIDLFVEAMSLLSYEI